MNFRVTYIPEPKLMFANGESFNPTVGLTKYGPRFSSKKEEDHKWIKVGMIGSSKSISLAHSLFEEMRYTIMPKKIVPWNIPFPGLSEDSPLKFSLTFDREWEQRITTDEIREIKRWGDRNSRIEQVLEMIDNKMKIIYEKSTPPDIIIISLPDEIEDVCVDPMLDNPLIKLENEDDFHSRIKVYGMKYKMPTQLIRPKTLLFKGTQDKPVIAWNLAVGILYKSQKGYPWKLTHLEENTCYVGISFFKETENKKKRTRASLAQLFLDTGESFILRGDPFEWKDARRSKTPHLSKEDAKAIIKKVLEQYKSVRGIYPERLVLHKSSNYWDDEYEGFLKASGDIQTKDFITLQDTIIKFYRTEEYPVLRGTLISSPNQGEHYLYTTGFAPCLDTYPGLALPRPLLIRAKTLDSPIQKVCEEVISFTKLDWNNTALYRKHPVTLAVSRRVGKVLSESEAKKIEIDPHYYFYM